MDLVDSLSTLHRERRNVAPGGKAMLDTKAKSTGYNYVRSIAARAEVILKERSLPCTCPFSRRLSWYLGAF